MRLVNANWRFMFEGILCIVFLMLMAYVLMAYILWYASEGFERASVKGLQQGRCEALEKLYGDSN